ncbi:MAG: hypothetical protein GX446_18045 [Chthonomonadales bacterium]|nr:hypothetical protein [Chthonomonadales bacterium]
MVWLLAAGAMLVPPAPVVNGIAYPDIMPVAQIRPGMKGYGLTVFHGSKIERFDVTVVAVVRNGSLIAPGHDMILIRMSGGPMTQRGANLIRGMSGSPIYLNGKCIGAFSQGEPTTKEPLGGVTPIMDMLEAWDPKLPERIEARTSDTTRPRVVELRPPIRCGQRTIRRIAFDSRERSWATASTLHLRPCTGMVTFTGGSPRMLRRVKELLEPYGVDVMQAPAGRSGSVGGGSLQPGAAFATLLMKGDVETGATGTVTYRRGNRLLGFGHPFLGMGPINAPICPATVHDVYPLNAGSYKISTPGPVLGMTQQDRPFGVSGVVGQKPSMIPITVNVDDRTTGRARVYRMDAVWHPNLTAGLVSLGVGSAIADMHGTPGPVMARIETVVEAEELGRIERRNFAYDARAVDLAATADLDAILNVVTNNPFGPLSVRSAAVSCVIEAGRRTATLERVAVKSNRYEPGDTVQVEVTLRPYRGEPVVRSTSLVIPEATPAGQVTLTVRGGGAPPSLSLGGITLRPSTGATSEQSPPANVRQMMDRLLERESGDEIGVRLSLPTSAVAADGRTLTGLPPTLDSALRSPRFAGTRLDRDEVRAVIRTDWVVTGQQTLTIQVQREAPTAAQPKAGESGAGPARAPASVGVTGGVISEFAMSSELAQSQRRRSAAPVKPGSPPQRSEAQPQVDQAPQTPAVQTKSDSGMDKPVARVAKTWRQTARADWKRATLHGVGITSEDDAKPVPVAWRVTTLPAPVVWCLVDDGVGGVYAGVGPEAAVFHVDSSGNSSLVARLPEASVHALLRMADGTLFAGTGPNGRTYRIVPGKEPAVVHDADESYVLCLAGGPDGTVYAGTGGPVGAVYRLLTKGTAECVARHLDRHVQSLALDAGGLLWAGTSGRGLLTRIAPDGHVETWFDMSGQSISAVLPLPDGQILVASAPKAGLFEVGDRHVQEITLGGSAALMALRPLKDGRVMAAGGTSGWLLKDRLGAPIGMPNGVEILSVAIGSDGSAWFGTANSGDILRADLSAQPQTGDMESAVLDAGGVSRWGRLRWIAQTERRGALAFSTRSGDSAEPDATWSPWAPLRLRDDGGDITSPPARYLQYRVSMTQSAADSVVALREVSVSYLPRNRPPTVTFQAPSGGELWSGKQTLRWQANDPDGDTLVYDLVCSSDGGASWTALPTADATAVTEQPKSPASPGASAGSATRRPLTVEQVTAELDKHPNLPPAMREAILDRTRKLNAEFAANQDRSAGPPTPVSTSRETSRAIDTSKLKDGVYRFRLTASDRLSNWDGPEAATVFSELVTVCNSPPVVNVLRSQIEVSSDGVVHLEAVVVQGLVSITAAQWRVEGGEWTAAQPADGFADGGLELFSVRTDPLPHGKRVIEIRAFNGSGLATTEKIEVQVPERKL